MKGLLATPIVDKTTLRGKEIAAGQSFINIESALASWSDISIIFDFFHLYTQGEVDESERIPISKGLNTFLADKM